MPKIGSSRWTSVSPSDERTLRTAQTLDLFARAITSPVATLSANIERRMSSPFCRDVEATVEPTLDIHVVLDNLSAHRAPPVQRWLLRPPRVHCHFTPTCPSWLNLVERFLAC